MYDLKKLSLPLLVVVALTQGCSDGERPSAETDKQHSEVVARVNGTALTQQQVNHALQRIPNLSEEQTPTASRQVIKNLVDQALLVQKSLDDKLDRDPAVVQALEAARHQILAEAYLSRKLGPPVEPTVAEIEAYYNAHPELFSERKLYRLQEVSVKAPEEQREAVRAKLAVSRTLNDFVAWLKAENISAQAGEGVKPAEQLPMEILPRLAQVEKGQAMVVNTPEGLLVVVVADSQRQPVKLEQAQPAIARMLQQQERQKAVSAEVKALKSGAKIEYLGAYAEALSAPAAVEPSDTDSN